MKKLILCLLVLLLLLGCADKPVHTAEPVMPFDFYYRTVETDYNSEQGVIRPQTRDVDGLNDYKQVFAAYMTGPADDDTLALPMPRGTVLNDVFRVQALLEFHFSEEYLSASGVDVSVADACIAKTAFGFDEITRVRILVEGAGKETKRDTMLDRSDILLSDNDRQSDSTAVTLYFADSARRYLLKERRAFSYPAKQAAPIETKLLAEFVVEQLIDGPQAAGLYPTLPDGTGLTSVSIEKGICSVDFNRDFYENRPTEERREQLALLSVVNSLCELDGIDAVLFFIEGKPMERYRYWDISDPFAFDGAAIGPIRPELNEFDGPLNLPDATDGKLHRLCSRIRTNDNESRADALIRTLLSYPSKNGIENPFVSTAGTINFSVEQNTCRLEFSANPFSDDPEKKDRAIRAIVGTFYEQPGMRIYRVQIFVQGELVTLTGKENLTSIYPQSDWYSIPS